MTGSALKTLLHPFETGLLDLPADARVLFLGAPGDLRLPAGFPRVTAVQGFRPGHLALAARGIDVRPVAEGEGYDAALVLCTRFRADNEANIAEALARIRPGGLIVVAGGKTDGIASLRKRVDAIAPVAGSASKHHGIVFWLARPAAAADAVEALAPGTRIVEGGFTTAAGVFSADGIDPASRLLADSLPDDLKGDIADFAAGWGYLAARLAERPGIRSIDLYEANHAALEAARTNLAGAAVPAGFFWHDLLGEPVARRYDAIVMNPPFHVSRAAEPDIGMRMIAAAGQALKKGGRLYLVANRPLPYEQALATTFAAHGEIVRDGRFKVLWARR